MHLKLIANLLDATLQPGRKSMVDRLRVVLVTDSC